MENKKVGDDGFHIQSESQAAADCAAYYTYNTLVNACKYTHEKALVHIGYSEGEFSEIKKQYEPTDEMLS